MLLAHSTQNMHITGSCELLQDGSMPIRQKSQMASLSRTDHLLAVLTKNLCKSFNICSRAQTLRSSLQEIATGAMQQGNQQQSPKDAGAAGGDFLAKDINCTIFVTSNALCADVKRGISFP